MPLKSVLFWDAPLETHLALLWGYHGIPCQSVQPVTHIDRITPLVEISASLMGRMLASACRRQISLICLALGTHLLTSYGCLTEGTVARTSTRQLLLIFLLLWAFLSGTLLDLFCGGRLPEHREAILVVHLSSYGVPVPKPSKCVKAYRGQL